MPSTYCSLFPEYPLLVSSRLTRLRHPQGDEGERKEIRCKREEKLGKNVLEQLSWLRKVIGSI